MALTYPKSLLKLQGTMRDRKSEEPILARKVFKQLAISARACGAISALLVKSAMPVLAASSLEVRAATPPSSGPLSSSASKASLGMVAVHALPPSPPPHLAPKLKQRFLKACGEAFIISATEVRDDAEGARALSRQVCECAADETKSQGASDGAVARETDAILKDRKHVIRDQHVLDALHYCAIEVLHGAGDDGT